MADAEIASALAQLKNSQEKATIITGGKSGQRQIALTFDGLSDRTTMQQVLDLLKKYNAKATFFVDGMQTAEDPQTVVNIKNAGYRIENYTLSGMGKMDTLPVERLVRDFCRAQKIIRVTTDQGPNLLKCNDTKYTDQVLQAARAAGFVSVVKSDAFVNVKQVNTSQAADVFVGSLLPGSIVSIKLKTNTEPVAKDAGKTEQKPAIDKQPGLKNLTQQADFGEKGTIEAVEKLLIALTKVNYTTVYVEDFAIKGLTKPVKTSLLPDSSLLVQHITAFWSVASSFIQEEAANFLAIRTAYAAYVAGAAAQEIKVITTTEPALSFTFGGISNEAVVNDMLTRLQNLGIKGTFFIADTEMKRYPGTLRTIINNGHELGIAIRPKDGETLEETQRLILRDRKLLQEQFGVDTYLVKQPWGAVTDTT
ncbi:MAG: polysaccharide deacetylase, partial [Anaerospora sp.]|nr:polysaccharide deacetylase [Anaerospora sp.]